MDFKTHKRKLRELHPQPTYQRIYNRYKGEIKFAIGFSLALGIASGLSNGADYMLKKMNENYDRERAALDRSYQK